MKIKKCLECGATVRILTDCTCDDCGITCCEKEMTLLKAGESDGAVEKHMPTYEIKDNMIYVTVDHVMEEDHFIEWISIVYPEGKKEIITYFNPGDKITAHAKYISGSKIYSYCNKHGLWTLDVE